MENDEFDIPEQEFYDVIVEHLRGLNRGLVELHQRVQTSLAQMDQMDQMDYQHKLPYTNKR